MTDMSAWSGADAAVTLGALSAVVPYQASNPDIETPTVTPTPVPKLVPKFKRHQPWPDWVNAVIAEWCQLWPEAFSKPLPLAIGITSQIRSLYHPDDTDPRKKKAIGVCLHFWSMQSVYLRAVARGETRRNLDGSEAGVPDEATRLGARRLLDERRDRREKRKQELEVSTSVAPPSYLPLTADSSSEVDCPPIIPTRDDNIKTDSDQSAAP